MAQEKKPAPKDRGRDVEALAAELFARRVTAGNHGKTSEMLATISLSDARAFYRVCDEVPNTGQPEKG